MAASAAVVRLAAGPSFVPARDADDVPL